MRPRRGHSTKRQTLRQTLKEDFDRTNDSIESMRRLDRTIDDISYPYFGTTFTERLVFEIEKLGRAAKREIFYAAWGSLKVTLILLFNVIGAVLFLWLAVWLLSVM